MTHLELSDEILGIEIIAERLAVLSQDICEEYFCKNKIETAEDKWILFNAYTHNSIKASMILEFALDISQKLKDVGKIIDDSIADNRAAQ